MNPDYTDNVLNDPVVNGTLRSINLPQALERDSALRTKKAYYMIEGPRNTETRFFGIIEESVIFRVDEEVYQMLGRPQGGKRIPVCPIAILDCYVRSK